MIQTPRSRYPASCKQDIKTPPQIDQHTLRSRLSTTFYSQTLPKCSVPPPGALSNTISGCARKRPLGREVLPPGVFFLSSHTRLIVANFPFGYLRIRLNLPRRARRVHLNRRKRSRRSHRISPSATIGRSESLEGRFGIGLSRIRAIEYTTSSRAHMRKRVALLCATSSPRCGSPLDASRSLLFSFFLSFFE